MRLSAQEPEPSTGRLDGLGLVVECAFEFQGLVSADHEARPLGGDLHRLQLGERVGDLARPGPLGQQGGLDRILIDARDSYLERYRGAAQDGGAGRTFGSQDDRRRVRFSTHPRTST